MGIGVAPMRGGKKRGKRAPRSIGTEEYKRAADKHGADAKGGEQELECALHTPSMTVAGLHV